MSHWGDYNLTQVVTPKQLHPGSGFPGYEIPRICMLFRTCKSVTRFLGYAYSLCVQGLLAHRGGTSTSSARCWAASCRRSSGLSPDICLKVAYCRNARDGARRQTLDLEQKWLQTNSRFLGYACLSGCATAAVSKRKHKNKRFLGYAYFFRLYNAYTTIPESIHGV